jgi:hypothetical protein
VKTRLPFVIVVLLVDTIVSSCTNNGFDMPQPMRSPTNAASGASRTESVTYRIIAPLLKTRRSNSWMACRTILTSLPPAGCSGVRIAGYDFRGLPGVRHAGGAWWSGPVALVGTWDGRTLHLTRPPRPIPGVPWAQSPTPDCRGLFSRNVGAMSRRLRTNAARIGLLELTPCGGRLLVLVAVRDRATVDLIHGLGTDVLIRGWLRPVR